MGWWKVERVVDEHEHGKREMGILGASRFKGLNGLAIGPLFFFAPPNKSTVGFYLGTSGDALMFSYKIKRNGGR